MLWCIQDHPPEPSPEPTAIARPVFLFLCLTAWAAAGAAAQDSAYPLDRVAAENRPAVIQAIKVLERECAVLAEVEWSKLEAPSRIVVAKAGAGLGPTFPFRTPLGWTAGVSIVIDRGPGLPVITVKAGGGKRPGIASRSTAKDLCGLTQRFGEFWFRDMPELRLLDALK